MVKIIQEGNELGVKEWHICGGGEPFFFKEDTLANNGKNKRKLENMEKLLPMVLSFKNL